MRINIKKYRRRIYLIIITSWNSFNDSTFRTKILHNFDKLQKRMTKKKEPDDNTEPVCSLLLGFLMRDCCQGHPDVCNPAVAALSCCKPTKGVTHA